MRLDVYLDPHICQVGFPFAITLHFVLCLEEGAQPYHKPAAEHAGAKITTSVAKLKSDLIMSSEVSGISDFDSSIPSYRSSALSWIILSFVLCVCPEHVSHAKHSHLSHEVALITNKCFRWCTFDIWRPTASTRT